MESLSKWLGGFKEDLECYIAKFERELVRELSRFKNSSFYEPLLYAIYGGKRIRPLILILSAESVGNKGKNPFPAAVAIELAHTESLIHDDILDQEVLRRGRESFYVKFGQSTSILSADYILGIVFNIVSGYQDPRILKEFSLMALKMCEGEMRELELKSDSNTPDLDTYIDIVENKTASQFCASAKIGAIIGGGSEREIEALSNYGKNFGIIYQIKDDLEDIKTSMGPGTKILSKKGETHLKEVAEFYSTEAKRSLQPLGNTKAKSYLLKMIDLQMST